MKDNKKRGLLLIITGLLAIDAALFLAIFNIFQDYKAGENVSVVLAQVETIDESDAKESISGMPEEEIDGEVYIGVLELPSLEIELPVINEWSYKALKIAPCRYSGSFYTDDMIILAHNYSSHFGRLKELELGDEVDFINLLGKKYIYQVVDKEILRSDDVEEMESGDYDLTLFTCTIGGKSRVTIRCERVE